MSSKEFEDVLIENLGIARDEAAVVWGRVIAAVRDALLAGRAVSLVHVVSIAPYEKAATRYRDPVSGKMMRVPPSRHLKLSLAATFKDLLRDDSVVGPRVAAWNAKCDAEEADRKRARQEAEDAADRAAGRPTRAEREAAREAKRAAAADSARPRRKLGKLTKPPRKAKGKNRLSATTKSAKVVRSGS